MSLERVCIKEVVTVSPHTNLLEVARLLRSQHVGSVVVVEEHRPAGILTDRDIILGKHRIADIGSELRYHHHGHPTPTISPIAAHAYATAFSVLISVCRVSSRSI